MTVNEGDPASSTTSMPPCAIDILIVEDESLVALDIRSQILKLGYTVGSICSSGEEALRAIAEERPALVLMDIRISGDLDGIEISRRAQREYDIPVIFLTASTDASTVERAQQTDCYGYLSKPFHPVTLATSIETALRKHRAHRELRRQHEWLAGIFGILPDGVIVTDDHSRILFMNAAAERLTGWTMAEARNQPFHTVLPIRDVISRIEVDDLVPYAIRSRQAASIPAGLHALSRS